MLTEEPPTLARVAGSSMQLDWSDTPEDPDAELAPVVVEAQPAPESPPPPRFAWWHKFWGGW